MPLSSFARVEQVGVGGHTEIGSRRIYILPTRYGMIYAVLVFLMLLGAVNYGNNPAHLLTFLLAALGSNAVYLTWRNLRGLRLRCVGSAPVFAGEPIAFGIELPGDGRERPALQLGFENAEPVLLDLPAGGSSQHVRVLLPALPRGEHPIGRLTISTQYPVGLFRAWCYVACDSTLLVYPRPGEAWRLAGQDAVGRDDGSDGHGSDDFAGLRSYVAGDQPSRIDWKSFARDRGLNTRLFGGESDIPLWIDWREAPGDDPETRLSSMCRAVLDADTAGQHFGLRLPSADIQPGSGTAHRHRCLRELAVHQNA
jgi:uncharacterized protein (DUF58 family)